MHITNSDVIHFCCSFFGGSGLGFLAIKLFIQKEAEKVLKPLLEKIEKDIEKIQDEYDECKQKFGGTSEFERAVEKLTHGKYVNPQVGLREELIAQNITVEQIESISEGGKTR